jgi:hypothetical protein
MDLVDRGERGPDTDAALDHLGGCGRCRDEVTELALTVAALRRASTAYRSLPVPVLVRPAVPARRPWAWRAQLGGLITSAGIAALLVAPQIGLGPTGAPFTLDGSGRPPAPAWQAAEHRIAVSPDIASMVAVSDSVMPRYPDGRLRPWKEVPSNDAAARGLDPK